MDTLRVFGLQRPLRELLKILFPATSDSMAYAIREMTVDSMYATGYDVATRSG